jgi:hypothetical protein
MNNEEDERLELAMLDTEVSLSKTDLMRFKEITLTLTQQTIIELAYAVMEVVGPLAKSHEKMYVEQGHGMTAAFYCIRELLAKVDPEYLAHHERVKNFNERTLVNFNDHLWWETDEEKAEREAAKK